jgi:hypothetical protein
MFHLTQFAEGSLEGSANDPEQTFKEPKYSIGSELPVTICSSRWPEVGIPFSRDSPESLPASCEVHCAEVAYRAKFVAIIRFREHTRSLIRPVALSHLTNDSVEPRTKII